MTTPTRPIGLPPQLDAPLVQLVEARVDELRLGDRFIDATGELLVAGKWLQTFGAGRRRREATFLRTSLKTYAFGDQVVLAASLRCKRAKEPRRSA
ncbi:MAG TPA: hypothetical protein VGE52_12260 [Pirellulales bacterium]